MVVQEVLADLAAQVLAAAAVELPMVAVALQEVLDSDKKAVAAAVAVLMVRVAKDGLVQDLSEVRMAVPVAMAVAAVGELHKILAMVDLEGLVLSEV